MVYTLVMNLILSPPLSSDYWESVKTVSICYNSSYSKNHFRCWCPFSRWTLSWSSGRFRTAIASFAITMLPAFTAIGGIAEWFRIIHVCESALIVIYISSGSFLISNTLVVPFYGTSFIPYGSKFILPWTI